MSSKWILGCLGFAITTAAALINYAEDERVQLMFQRATLQQYDQDRFDGQRFAINLFSEWPLGYGPGSTVITAPGTLMPINDPHNVYIKLATELGVQGAPVYVSICVITLLAYSRSRGGADSLKTLLASYFLFLIVSGFVVDTTHWRPFYLAMGMLLGPSMKGRAPAVTKSYA